MRLVLKWMPSGIFPYSGYNRKVASFKEEEAFAHSELHRFTEIPAAWNLYRREDRKGLYMSAGWFIIEVDEPETNELGEIHP